MSEFLTVKSLPSRYEEWSKIIISVKKTRYFDDYFQSIEGGLGDNIGIRVKWKYKLFPAVKFWTVETLSYEALSSHGLAVLCGLSIKSSDYARIWYT